MKSVWRIKNSWPGSPPIGTIVSESMSEYYEFLPKKNLHLFEELSLDTTLVTEDGVTLFPGDNYYFVDSYKWTISFNVFSDPAYLMTSGYNVWSTKELAQDELDHLIYLEIEGEELVGKNVPLWGCLISQAPFLLAQDNSLVLWRKRKKKCSPPNPNWKWFSSEEKRSEYMSSIELKWTKKDLRDVLEKCNLNENEIIPDGGLYTLLCEITKMSK